MAEGLMLTKAPREDFSGRSDGKGHTFSGTHAAHAHTLTESLDEDRAKFIFRFSLKSTTPAEDGPRLRHGKTLLSGRGDAEHTFESLHQRRRRPGQLVSVAQLPFVVCAPRVDPAIPAEGEAVDMSGGHATHPNLSHGVHRRWDRDNVVSIITVAS
jgi:hypothetical protein